MSGTVQIVRTPEKPMNRTLTCRITPHRQRGQSTIEYVVISAVLVVCLFATATPAGRQMAQAICTFYSDLTFFLSLP